MKYLINQLQDPVSLRVYYEVNGRTYTSAQLFVKIVDMDKSDELIFGEEVKKESRLLFSSLKGKRLEQRLR